VGASPIVQTKEVKARKSEEEDKLKSREAEVA
jgi:hypothetical protein